jgi:glycosyltransferase involved in cell wall biosynthesis
MISQGALAHKISLHRQYIDCSHFDFREPEYSEKLSVCTLGRFVEKKGIRYLILSAKGLPNVEFNIYGFGDLKEDYLRIIKDNKLSNVKIKDSLKDSSEVNRVIADHDLFVLPCVKSSNGDMDGIPTVLAESMLIGTPVITTDISSIPDIINDEVNGFLVPQKNPLEITNKIKRFSSLSPIERASISHNGRNSILKFYDKSDLIARYKNIWFNKTIDIFLVSYNNLNELKFVINRIYRFTTCYFNLIIVDNDSSLETKEYLRELEKKTSNVKIELLEENILCGPASNIALSLSTSDYAIYLCSKEGFVMNYDWEWEMINFMDTNEKVGIAGHKNISPSFDTYERLADIDVFANFRNQDFIKDRLDKTFSFLQGGIYIIRKKMYDEIGGFNDLTPHNHMDVEYSYYAESKGWDVAKIDDISSLTVKTRPNLEAYFNDSSKVIHPMTIVKSRDYDEVIKNKYHHCSVCGKVGRFKDVCPKCHARPEQRMLYKYFAPHEKIYRKNTVFFNKSLKGVENVLKKMFTFEMIEEPLSVIKFAKKNAVFIENVNTEFFNQNEVSVKKEIECLKNSNSELIFCGKTRDLDTIVTLCRSNNIQYEMINFSSHSDALKSHSLVVIR